MEIDSSSLFYSFLLHSAECHALTEFSTKVGHVARDLPVTAANQDSYIFAGDAKAGIARNVFVCICVGLASQKQSQPHLLFRLLAQNSLGLLTLYFLLPMPQEPRLLFRMLKQDPLGLSTEIFLSPMPLDSQTICASTVTSSVISRIG